MAYDKIMVDLETVGTRAGCGILSIGAVAYDTEAGELGREFYQVVDIQSCYNVGLFSESETLMWWKDRPEEARKVMELAQNKETSIELSLALTRFNQFIELVQADFNASRSDNGITDVEIYGNGADFDNAILIVAYAAVKLPWSAGKFSNRCYRTDKVKLPHIKIQRIGTHHSALDDAKSQALHHIKLVQFMKRAFEIQLAIESIESMNLEPCSEQFLPNE